MLKIHKGLYRNTKIAFGVKLVTEIYQTATENHFKGLTNTIVRVEDVLVGGRDYQNLFINFRNVLPVQGSYNRLSLTDSQTESYKHLRLTYFQKFYEFLFSSSLRMIQVRLPHLKGRNERITN